LLSVGTAAVAAPAHAVGVVKGVVAGGVLTVTGTGGADDISVLPSGSNLVVADNLHGTVLTFDATTFNSTIVRGQGGADRITASNGLSTLTALTIDGGGGNDTLVGGDGTDTVIGGAGNDIITGGRNNDTLLGGTGNDTFVWNPGDGSDTIEGQDGTDTFRFNGANIAENLAISANGARTTFTRDIAAITTDLGNVEHIDTHLLGGADNLTVGDLTATFTTAVTVDLANPPTTNTGDGTADHVTVTGTNEPDHITVTGGNGAAKVAGLTAAVSITGGAEFPGDRLDINTLTGADTVVSKLPPAVLSLFVNGVPK
jgi:hypothetical protein